MRCATESSTVSIDWDRRRVEIEYAWIAGPSPQAPLMVFLHEGLGSLGLWKDFPARLCQRIGFRGLVYSRPGYGRSTPRARDEHWAPDFMHRQALDVLPALLRVLEVDPGDNCWLFGHSDGGSIALLYAADTRDSLSGVIAMAPHIFVETLSVESIEQTRQTYLETDLRDKLARYHDDPDSAFWGWNDIWLSQAFRDWNIVDDIAAIACPLLAVQGTDDEYGTLEQVRGIEHVVEQTWLRELPGCGHSPHRDNPELLIDTVSAFVAAHRADKA